MSVGDPNVMGRDGKQMIFPRTTRLAIYTATLGNRRVCIIGGEDAEAQSDAMIGGCNVPVHVRLALILPAGSRGRGIIQHRCRFKFQLSGRWIG
jgi:hypothetical protein